MEQRSETVPDLRARSAYVAAVVAIAASVGVIVGFAAYWERYAFVDLPFGVPPALAFLGSVAALQVVRVGVLNDPARQIGAAATIPGAVVTIVGLMPVRGCGDSIPHDCSASLNPNLFAIVGVCLVAAGVYLDVQGYIDR